MIAVISLWMPWAQWVMLGWKTVETRKHNRFASLAGKNIAIHAAQKWDNDALIMARKYLGADQMTFTLNHMAEWKQQHAGRILCRATCLNEFPCKPEHATAALIECDTPRRGLHLVNVRRSSIMPRVAGKQGIFYYDGDL